ncbi:proline and glycine rich transmembrane protein [Vibrio sp. JCM 18904]|nr:proline and glycine rich transmembrane protein [Vibrio sp. JCM 18904]
MNDDFEKDFNLGGSVERALSGNYELKAGAVFNEAWRATIQHFLSFSPAIIVLLFVQLGIFYIALKLQLGDLSVILDAFENPESFTNDIVSSIYVANFSYEVISAPIYAGISLMAMSHVAGLKTKLRHVGKGLQFTIPVILATLMSLMLQGVVGMIFPLLSLYLSLAFSHSILLICEKRVPPMQALLLSLRAINKKIFVVAGGLYLGVMLMFIIAAMFYGIGLIFVLPFFFHLKGILYREMFGIKLKIVTTQKNDNDHDGNSQVFDA